MGSLLGILLGSVGKFSTVGQAGQNTVFPPPLGGGIPVGGAHGNSQQKRLSGIFLLGNGLLGIGKLCHRVAAGWPLSSAWWVLRYELAEAATC
jgi:hypothetical protein